MENSFTNNYKIEVCIDSVESAIASEKGGAQRVELCDNLFEGGTTPSAGCIQLARKEINIGLFVMIRPRGGDFLYSDIEYEVMKADILTAKGLGADGVVFGLLNADGTIDKKKTEALVKLARPLGVTFHRAFDMTPDPHKALRDLIEVGVDRILTSGQEASAYEGADLISELVKEAKNSVIIMPGGGISEKNISKIRQMTNCNEFHVTGRIPRASSMQYFKSGVYMGGELRMEEFKNYFTDSHLIKEMKNRLL